MIAPASVSSHCSSSRVDAPEVGCRLEGSPRRPGRSPARAESPTIRLPTTSASRQRRGRCRASRSRGPRRPNFDHMTSTAVGQPRPPGRAGPPQQESAVSLRPVLRSLTWSACVSYWPGAVIATAFSGSPAAIIAASGEAAREGIVGGARVLDRARDAARPERRHLAAQPPRLGDRLADLPQREVGGLLVGEPEGAEGLQHPPLDRPADLVSGERVALGAVHGGDRHLGGGEGGCSRLSRARPCSGLSGRPVRSRKRPSQPVLAVASVAPTSQ